MGKGNPSSNRLKKGLKAMNERYSIKRYSLDKLKFFEWIFWLNGTDIWLDKYFEYRRETKRHKFNVEEKYDKIFTRNNSISVDDVPLPDDVVSEVKNIIVSNLKVKRWNKP